MTTKKYLHFYLLFILLFAFSLAIFNAVVDPYLMFHTDRIAGFNDKKPRAVNRTQLYKPYEILRVSPQTLIVGNSRPEMGLNPQSECWLDSHGNIYSLTFPGLGAYGQIRAAFHGLATGNVRHIVLGLDFIDFLYKRKKNIAKVTWPDRQSDFFDRLLVDAQFQRNPDYWTAKATDTFMSMFTLDALFDSFYTIISQSSSSPDRTSSGFNPAHDYTAIIQHEGAWVLFKQKMGELESHFSRPGMRIFDTKTGWSLELEGLKRLIEYCLQNNIQVTLFTNPYHYSYLEIIRQAGYWKEFENYKRSLKTFVEQYEKDRIQLWDFSLYSHYTVSLTPTKKGEREPDWFWEPAHYKSTLGDIMLSEIFGKDCIYGNHTIPFGVRLNNTDIETHLYKQNQQRILLIKKLSPQS